MRQALWSGLRPLKPWIRARPPVLAAQQRIPVQHVQTPQPAQSPQLALAAQLALVGHEAWVVHQALAAQQA